MSLTKLFVSSHLVSSTTWVDASEYRDAYAICQRKLLELTPVGASTDINSQADTEFGIDVLHCLLQ